MTTKTPIAELIQKRDNEYNKITKKIIERCEFVRIGVIESYEFEMRGIEFVITTVMFDPESKIVLFRGTICAKTGSLLEDGTLVTEEISLRSVKDVMLGLPPNVVESNDSYQVAEYLNNIRADLAASISAMDAEFDYDDLSPEQIESLKLHNHEFHQEMESSNGKKLN